MKNLREFVSAKADRPILIRHAIAGGSILLGVCWIGAITYPTLLGIGRGLDPFDVVFLLTIVSMMMIQGALAAFFGVRLFRAMSVGSLKWVVGVFFAFGVIALSV